MIGLPFANPNDPFLIEKINYINTKSKVIMIILKNYCVNYRNGLIKIIV